jgi:hypothetical protein
LGFSVLKLPSQRSLSGRQVGWAVLYIAWLNQGDIFVGMLCAKRIEQAPSDDPPILNLPILNHVF